MTDLDMLADVLDGGTQHLRFWTLLVKASHEREWPIRKFNAWSQAEDRWRWSIPSGVSEAEMKSRMLAERFS